MTAKLMVTASLRAPPLTLDTRNTDVPAPTVMQWAWYAPAVPPVPTDTTTTSVALMALLVQVNCTVANDARLALCMVIWPDLAFTVTAVVLLVPWVTVP